MMLYELTKRNLEDHLYSRLHEFLSCYGNGLIPEQLGSVNMHDVLDVGCGLGEWLLDMAFKYPEKEFVGLDNHAARLDYARAYASVQGIEHVRFVLGDMLQMPFNDDSYALVHGRFLLMTMTAMVRRALLNELLRVCASGGYVLLQETLFPVTNSAACMYWFDLFRLAFERAEIAPLVVSEVEHQLCLTGCRAVQHVDTAISISYGTAAHRALCTHVSELQNFLAPFLLSAGVVAADQLDRIYMHVQIDLVNKDFVGVWPAVAFIGQK
jgi:ubiquinone/menaquinone biosynthesis C-methylase UbiE